ncbi:glycine betaine uptake BCCT transporter [Pseudalkalibacillus caeni]|uniref:BCCT family transporter n=1 Tax=Exobacillus caeni TaxID=2574798 RepID=A0A5R9F5K8_9BACL|nr:BCCT family transporter [Pseudalkalibacillus caeni]TLS36103.1 BCCT family transporter [Pseudalkalibacillus caeni]
MESKSNIVFWFSAIIITLFVIWAAVSPESLGNNASAVFDFTTKAFGWFYLLAVLFFVLFCFYLAFSRFGKVRLGKDSDRPEYSFFTWIGMLFSAGFGVGLVFWGVAEPMQHYFAPPLGAPSQTTESAQVAMRYSFFHWGIHQWSVFTIVGLAIAYYQFRKGVPSLISNTFNPLIGDKGKNYLRKPIDILAVIATVTGVATSLGMGILQINGGLNHVFGIPNNAVYQLIITFVLLVLYLSSSTTGLNKGIKYLSNLNLSLALGLLLFVFIVGPTVFILDSFTLALGQYIQRFFEMSLRLTPYGGGTWVRDWTIFYWAWVIAWSPFVGAFIARVSRGRTIREFVFGVLIVPPFIAIVWLAVFGGSALHLDMFENTAIAEAVQNDVTVALFAMFEHFPFSFVLSILSMLLIFTFLVTSADSATYVLGMMTQNGKLNPSMMVKIIWGVLIAAIAAVLIISSGLQGLQTASLVAALPFTFILIIMCIALFKALRQDHRKQKVK